MICLVSHLGIVGIVMLAVVTTFRDVYHFDSPYNVKHHRLSPVDALVVCSLFQIDIISSLSFETMGVDIFPHLSQCTHFSPVSLIIFGFRSVEPHLHGNGFIYPSLTDNV